MATRGKTTDPNGPQNQPRPPAGTHGQPGNDIPRPNQGGGNANDAGYSPIHYGAKGEQVGIAKAGQARNQPGFVPRGQRDGVPNGPADGGTTDPNGPATPAAPVSYLNEAQQAKVDKLLGDKYDPTKPLNVQLFKARWADATPEERRAIAKNVSGQFMEGGPTSKTLAGFHSEYLGVLNELNSVKQQELDQHVADFGQTLGGFAQSKSEYDANLKYWTDFAATPEGQAHIAQTGMSQSEWLARETEDMKSGLHNYNTQVKKYAQIASLQQQLGITPTGMKPPGWDSTLLAIQSGHAPLPSASMMANYPGIAADLSSISPDLYDRNASISANRNRGGGSSVSGTQTQAQQDYQSISEMPYQPLYAPNDAFGADEISQPQVI